MGRRAYAQETLNKEGTKLHKIKSKLKTRYTARMLTHAARLKKPHSRGTNKNANDVRLFFNSLPAGNLFIRLLTELIIRFL